MLTVSLKKSNSEQKKYRGRFAPSPSGELHFGSLLAAMASYADARSHHGSWLLRIDDIDLARVVSGADQHIIKTLEQCGFQWDEGISYQSQFVTHYQQALEQLVQADLTYPCVCSRKQIKNLSNSHSSKKGVYPGTCRNKAMSPQSLVNSAVRIKVSSEQTSFIDKIQQTFCQHLNQEVGDFIIFRRDKIFTYQLSVVVDDYLSQINHVIRGYDLLESTPRQIYLQHKLNYPVPQYAHIPLAVTQDHVKLSKLSHAKKIRCDLKTLVLAAQFLGQNILNHSDYENTMDFWQHLFIIWDINKVPKMEKQEILY